MPALITELCRVWSFDAFNAFDGVNGSYDSNGRFQSHWKYAFGRPPVSRVCLVGVCLVGVCVVGFCVDGVYVFVMRLIKDGFTVVVLPSQWPNRRLQMGVAAPEKVKLTRLACHISSSRLTRICQMNHCRTYQ